MKFLQKAIQGISFFQKVPEMLEQKNSLQYMSKYLRHEHFVKHQIIMKQGNSRSGTADNMNRS